MKNYKLSKFRDQNAKIRELGIIQLVVYQDACAAQHTILLLSLLNYFCQCERYLKKLISL